MRRISHYGIAILLAHGLVSLVHDIAHYNLGVEVSLLQWLYVFPVWIFIPLFALVCLCTGRLRSGALLLFLCMFAALVFAGINHFVIVSKDHVLHAPAGASLPVFQVTAVLMTILEIVGCWIGGWALASFARLKVG